MSESEKNPSNLNMVIHANGIERIPLYRGALSFELFTLRKNNSLTSKPRVMKKVLFFLFIANSALAQTDSSLVRTDSVKTIFKDDVVVSATRAKENSPTTFQTISKEELNKNNLGQDMPILLDNTPSVVTTSDEGAGNGYTGIRIRDSDATRINLTLNFIPVNDA